MIRDTKNRYNVFVKNFDGWLNLGNMSWNAYLNFIHHPTDPSSLGVFRMLFGLLMVIDIADERGFALLDKIWAPNICTFPLFDFMQPMPLDYMCILYSIMWLGAVGICIGYRYRLSCAMFLVPYLYIFIMNKSAWNNHTYLYALLSLLLSICNADNYLSVDKRKTLNEDVPRWNYILLRFQVFILYFMAGVKKFNSEWLGGHSLPDIGYHPTFSILRKFISGENISFWLIHVCGFLIDMFAGFGLIFKKTRVITYIILLMFHLINSRLFTIGVFPYVGIVSMFLFSSYDWPKKLTSNHKITKIKKIEENCIKRNVIGIFIIVYAIFQFFLPFSHFITQGFNGWTNGLYGYSWDMMVYNCDVSTVVFEIKVQNETHYMDAITYGKSNKWLRHPDMIVQYAKYIKNKLQLDGNVSIHIDAWGSLNNRIYQRMYDPRVDLLNVRWSVFERPKWTMPLLTEFDYLRARITKLRKEIHQYSNFSEAIFISDFPGYSVENYITEDLRNVSLRVLGGSINVLTNYSSHTLNSGDTMDIPFSETHQIFTISKSPSIFMYSYFNVTQSKIQEKNISLKEKLNRELLYRYWTFKRSFVLMFKSIFNILRKFEIPLII